MLSMGLNVMWVAKCRYEPGHVCQPHSHKFYHYLFILNGTGQITIGRENFILQENYLYLTPVNTPHGFSPEKGKGFQAIEIKFALDDSEMREKVDGLGRRFADTQLFVKHSLENIVEKGVLKEEYYSDVINLKFAEILFYMMKKPPVSKPLPEEELTVSASDADLAMVVDYMSRNMRIQIELETLAKLVNLNASYFCKLFKLRYGVPPINYLNRLRLARAKELLRYSDMNITQISCEVGFQSVHYFSRFFTCKESISPHEYRMKFKDNIFINVDENKKSTSILKEGIK